jgi:AraC-like DNA-binding protein
MAQVYSPTYPKIGTSASTLSQLTTIIPFIQIVRERGLAAAPVLEKYGLNNDLVLNPEVFVHSDIIYGIVADFAAMSDDVFFGVHVGEKMDFATWPPFRDAVLNSDKMGEFLVRLIEAIPKGSSAVRYNLNVEADFSELVIKRQYQSAISTVHVDGFGIAFFSRLFESIVGQEWDPASVTVSALDVSGVPNRYKGMTLMRSNLNDVRVRIPTPWLYRRIELNSALTIERQIVDPSVDTPVSVVEAFCALAVNRLDDPDLSGSSIAATMGLSERKLRRILQKNGTSSRKEIQRLRLDYAEKALRDEKTDISEIAFRIGFAEPANFSRFFRSRTGQSPREFRKKHRRG